jgi:hypothetical protein
LIVEAAGVPIETIVVSRLVAAIVIGELPEAVAVVGTIPAEALHPQVWVDVE